MYVPMWRSGSDVAQRIGDPKFDFGRKSGFFSSCHSSRFALWGPVIHEFLVELFIFRTVTIVVLWNLSAMVTL